MSSIYVLWFSYDVGVAGSFFHLGLCCVAVLVGRWCGGQLLPPRSLLCWGGCRPDVLAWVDVTRMTSCRSV